MPLPTIADVFRCALNWDNLSNTATNVIHVSAPGSTETDVFNELEANVTDNMWNTVADGSTVGEVVVTKLDGTPDGRVFPTDTVGAAWSGSGGSQYIPQGSALVKLATGATGRSGRGRIYLPHLAEGIQSAGDIDGTTQTAATAAWVAFANALVSDGMALVVASYKLGTASQVLNLRLESKAATQRKRQRR